MPIPRSPLRFSPVSTGVGVVPRPTSRRVPAAPAVGNTTFTVASDGPSLRGFQVYLRDPATLDRVSSRTTLGDVLSSPVTLITAEVPTLQGKQLVIQPPAGLPIPTLADTLPPVMQLQSERFPSLPAPVTVAGVVRDATPAGNPIEADLVIVSAPGGIVDTDIDAPNTQQALSYSTSAHSSPIDGSYSVVLPPGTYQAYLVPASGVAAGATSLALEVAPPESGEPSAGAGKTLIAAALGTIAGTAAVADGHPLSGAAVEAHAAASLAGIDRRLWPRTALGVTDANGRFSLSVDPGTYDVVVRPVDGSGFPWVTTTSVIIVAGGEKSLPVVVPAPILVELTLHDLGENPISSAIVQAFAPLERPVSNVPSPIAGAGAPDSSRRGLVHRRKSAI